MAKHQFKGIHLNTGPSVTLQLLLYYPPPLHPPKKKKLMPFIRTVKYHRPILLYLGTLQAGLRHLPCLHIPDTVCTTYTRQRNNPNSEVNDNIAGLKLQPKGNITACKKTDSYLIFHVYTAWVAGIKRRTSNIFPATGARRAV